jgi:hypothetical protein
LLAVAIARRARLGWPKWMEQGMPYAIGTVAAFWTIERVGAWI